MRRLDNRRTDGIGPFDIKSAVRRVLMAVGLGLAVLGNVRAQSLPDDIVQLWPVSDFSGYTWIVGSWTELLEAQASAFEYHAEGYKPFIIPVDVDGVKRYRVAFGRFQTREDAVQNRPPMPPDTPSNAWIAEFRPSQPKPLPAPEPEPVVERVELSRVTAAEPESPVGEIIWNSLVAVRATSEVSVESSSNPKEQGAEAKVDRLRRSPWHRYVVDRTDVNISFLSRYESNIEYSADGRDMFGFVPAVYLRYKVGQGRSLMVVNYFGARHDYASTSQWDRWSHVLNATALPDQRGHFRYDTALQLSRTVLSEENQLSDDVQLRQRFEYRFSSAYRFRIYGTLRWERYLADPDENAFRPNIAAMLIQRPGSGATWLTEARWEANDVESERSRYRRLTFVMLFSQRVFRADELGLEITHRRRKYIHREVEVDGEQVLRRDLRWLLRVRWVHRFGGGLHALARYQYQRRDSNDASRNYVASMLDLGFIYHL